MKIVDNFLLEDYFKELQKLVYSNTFPWFYQKQTTTFEDDNNFMFTHTLVENQKINSSELKFAGFLKIKNTKNNVVLFKGWMFSYSPSISEFYDQQFAIKLIKCKTLTNQDP